MPITPRHLLRVAGTAFFLALPATFATSLFFPVEALAQTKKAALPAPYVSKALGAVLIQITPEVRKAFNLKKKKQGVLILSVQPGGVAAKQGLKPGDVIDNVKKGGKGGTKASDKTKGKKVRKPQDLDAILLYWLTDGYDGFYFAGSRGGVYFLDYGFVTLDEYYYAYDLASISSWDSDWYGATYAYEEYSYSYSETITTYSEEITESYEYSETYAEEVTSSEEFTAEIAEADTEMSSEEVAEEEEINQDQASDPEEDFVDDGTDTPADEATSDEADEASAIEGADESATDEAVMEDGADEAAAVDESADEPTMDAGSDEAAAEEEAAAPEEEVDYGSDEAAVEDYGTCDCSDPDCALPECAAVEEDATYSEEPAEDTSADESSYDDSGESGGDEGGGDEGGSEEYVE